MSRIERSYSIEEKIKYAKKLYDRYLELQEIDRKLGYIKLENPIFDGYKRYYVVREDLMRSKKKHALEEILSHINTTIHCKNKNFEYLDRKSKKMKPMSQSLAPLSQKDYDKLRPGLQKYFYKTFTVQYSLFSRGWSREVVHYKFANTWMFVFKVTEHYITKSKVFDPEIDSELKYLKDKLYGQNLFYQYLSYDSHSDIWDRKRNWNYRAPIKNKIKSMITHGDFEDDK